MVVLSVLWNNSHAVVLGVQFGLLPQPPRCRVLGILTNGQPEPLSFLSPFDVVRAFGVPILLTVHHLNVRTDATIRAFNGWAVPQP